MPRRDLNPPEWLITLLVSIAVGVLLVITGCTPVPLARDRPARQMRSYNVPPCAVGVIGPCRKPDLSHRKNACEKRFPGTDCTLK